jgi:hypothetical protein
MDVKGFRGLRLPSDSRVPDASSGSATATDYDDYFKLHRGPVDLLEWSEDCLALEQDLLGDLRATDLSEREQNRMLMGMVLLYRATLERWTRAAHQL